MPAGPDAPRRISRPRTRTAVTGPADEAGVAEQHVHRIVRNDGPGPVERRAAAFDTVDGLERAVRVERPDDLAVVGRVGPQPAVGRTREHGARHGRDGRGLRLAAGPGRLAQQRLRRRVPDPLAGPDVERVDAAGLLVEEATDGNIHRVAFDGTAPDAADGPAVTGAVFPQPAARSQGVHATNAAGL